MQLKPRQGAERDLMTEQEYRSIRDRLSYSSIKLFDEDRKKFYEEHILGLTGKGKKETLSMIMGSLVHLYLAEQNFNDKFHMLTAIQPKGQMLTLTENLYDRTLMSIVHDEDLDRYVVNEKFEVLMSDAIQVTKYNHDGQEVAFKNKDMAKIVSLFENSDAEIYYKEKMDNIGKSVVSTTTVTKAEDIVSKLRGHPYTHEYANSRSGKDLDIYHELPILFDIKGVGYKSLIDKLEVHHDIHHIVPLDWKTSWDNEDPAGAYLKLGYYLQGAMYDLAIRYWANQNGYEDYTIDPMRFIFCDTSGWADPIVLTLTRDDIERAMRGFTIRGYRYRGLNELMLDIAWHQENGNWATSKAIAEANGIIKLKLPYGSR